MPYKLKRKPKLPANVAVHIKAYGTYCNNEYQAGELIPCPISHPQHVHTYFKLSKENLTQLLIDGKLTQSEFIPIDVEADLFLSDKAVTITTDDLIDLSLINDVVQPQKRITSKLFKDDETYTLKQIAEKVCLSLQAVQGHRRSGKFKVINPEAKKNYLVKGYEANQFYCN